MTPLLIAGIGNVLLGDDGIGPAAVRALAERGEIAGAEIEDLGTPGLELAGYLAYRRAVILVDALRSDVPAGTLRVFDKAEILAKKIPQRDGPHAPSLVEALRGLEFAGAAPEELILICVAGEDFTFGAGLSRAGQTAVETALGEIDRQLALHGWPAQPCRIKSEKIDQ